MSDDYGMIDWALITNRQHLTEYCIQITRCFRSLSLSLSLAVASRWPWITHAWHLITGLVAITFQSDWLGFFALRLSPSIIISFVRSRNCRKITPPGPPKRHVCANRLADIPVFESPDEITDKRAQFRNNASAAVVYKQIQPPFVRIARFPRDRVRFYLRSVTVRIFDCDDSRKSMSCPWIFRISVASGEYTQQTHAS